MTGPSPATSLRAPNVPSVDASWGFRLHFVAVALFSLTLGAGDSMVALAWVAGVVATSFLLVRWVREGPGAITGSRQALFRIFTSLFVVVGVIWVLVTVPVALKGPPGTQLRGVGLAEFAWVGITLSAIGMALAPLGAVSDARFRFRTVPVTASLEVAYAWLMALGFGPWILWIVASNVGLIRLAQTSPVRALFGLAAWPMIVAAMACAWLLLTRPLWQRWMRGPRSEEGPSSST